MGKCSDLLASKMTNSTENANMACRQVDITDANWDRTTFTSHQGFSQIFQTLLVSNMGSVYLESKRVLQSKSNSIPFPSIQMTLPNFKKW